MGQFTGEDNPDGLNLGNDGGLLVTYLASLGFMSKLLEDVIDEAVHDTHSFSRDPYVWMNLLQHLEDRRRSLLSRWFLVCLDCHGKEEI
ncbi:hypothetical protein HAX54_039272 [Datura stramonium]|uniref:Uncharacterized protein n=1 Tax=Datura stramonium TaxID=4076 RepID=A0ABS8SIV7_DATST|nr:hypothetical protein [Datura stramonium]